jgi:hypothetical protein
MGRPYQLGDRSSRWFLGAGSGGFAEAQPGEATAFGWGAAIFDADNDGDSDIAYHGGLEITFIGLRDNPGVLLENQGLCSGTFTTDTAALGGRHVRRNAHGLAIGDLDRDGTVDMVTAASWTTPTALPLVPSPAAYGDPLDATAFFVPIFSLNAGGDLVWSGVELGRGDLMIELNDGNSNGSVTIRPVGAVDLIPGGAVNRGGIGAVVSFQPEGGVRATTPITGGSSHASAHAAEAYFGLGSAPYGTVDVLWPGGVKNRLYGVKDGENVVVPEIPCSYDTAASVDVYARCVRRAVDRLYARGVIASGHRQRLMASALAAYLNVP